METKEFSLTDKLTFGKYKGLTIGEVIEDDLSYIEWAIDEIDWFELDQEATEELESNYIDNDDYMAIQ